jgi:hypothetical protein
MLTALALLALAGSGCNQNRPAAPATTAAPRVDAAPVSAVPRLPKEALAPLTEAEFDRLAKVVPKVNKVLSDAKYGGRMPEGESFAIYLVRYIEGMERLPGMDFALKTGNMSWQEFRKSMYKFAAASFAVSIDQTAAKLDAMRAVAAEVPSTNKRFVIEHQAEISMVQPIGQ